MMGIDVHPTLVIFVLAACGLLGLGLAASGDEPPATVPRPRAREAGIRIGILPPGPLNSITDVSGVAVGHRTRVEGDRIRTGITAIVPHPGNLFQEKVPAAVVVGNGFGKLVGSTQVAELGVLETPILLTNTLSTFAVADALVGYTLQQTGNQGAVSVNPLVGECNDSGLNDIRARVLGRDDALAALATARPGPVAEGSVGAGTGTLCFGWKGGIGTASRTLPAALGGHTVGVLVQTNFDGVLKIAGAPVGEELGRHFLRRSLDPRERNEGSCMVVVATDAPLDARPLQRLARRALLGLGNVGSPMTHGSGDYVIAFSVHPALRQPHSPPHDPSPSRPVLRDEALSPLFQAVIEATEEAVVNSLFRATTVRGYRGRVAEAIPIDRVLEICRRHGGNEAETKRP